MKANAGMFCWVAGFARSLIVGCLLISTSIPSSAAPDPRLWDREKAEATERQAYACSALMLILTSASEPQVPKELNATATQFGMIFASVAGSATSMRLGDAINNGYVTQVRDREVRIILAKWQTDKAGVTKTASDCLGWGLSIKEELASGKLSSPTNARFQPPYEQEDIRFVSGWLDRSFDAFQKMGGVTPSDIKEMLRRDLR
ncbi:MAG: hypothetical protein ACR650_03965 [Methylocystis sp.]